MIKFDKSGDIKMAVYCITNKVTGKSYIGKSVGCVKDRWKAHIKDMRNTSYICKSLRKHGRDAFTFEVIDLAETKEQLSYKEQFWIEQNKTLVPNGYNLTTGGENTRATKALKRKFSKAAKNRFADESERLAQSERIKRSWTPELRKAKSEIAKKQFSDPEMRKLTGTKSRESWAVNREMIIAAQNEGRRAAREAGKIYTRPVLLSDGRCFASGTECAAAIGFSPAMVALWSRGHHPNTNKFGVRYISVEEYKAIMQQMNAPKMIVRDQNGKALGIQSAQ